MSGFPFALLHAVQDARDLAHEGSLVNRCGKSTRYRRCEGAVQERQRSGQQTDRQALVAWYIALVTQGNLVALTRSAHTKTW